MTDEIWKPVVGAEDLYEVSDQGRVRSVDREVYIVRTRGVPYTAFYRGRLLTPRPRRGYLSVHFRDASSTKVDDYLVHRLVLEAFVGPAPEGYEAAHNNGCRTDNRLCNLRWATKKENGQDKVLHGRSNKGEKNPHAKLTDSDVIEIRRLVANNLASLNEISARFAITSMNVRYIVKRKSWSHVGDTSYVG